MARWCLAKGNPGTKKIAAWLNHRRPVLSKDWALIFFLQLIKLQAIAIAERRPLHKFACRVATYPTASLFWPR